MKEFNFASLVGRTYQQANCWDIVREFYLMGYVIELKNYVNGAPGSRHDVNKLIYSHAGDFEKVEGEPEFGDILVIRMQGIESHIGVYVGRGKFLHSSETNGSVVESLEKWSKRIAGVYRLRAGRAE